MGRELTLVTPTNMLYFINHTENGAEDVSRLTHCCDTVLLELFLSVHNIFKKFVVRNLATEKLRPIVVCQHVASSHSLIPTYPMLLLMFSTSRGKFLMRYTCDLP